MSAKKALVLAIPALLFLCITAIMIGQGREAEPLAVPAAAAARAPTLVIDPGHGGLDGGAVSVNGQPESGVNLAIALKTRDLARLFGLAPVMTRSGEALDYPQTLDTIHQKKVWDQNTRIELINSVPNALLLSIHQNKFPDPRPSGCQVLYGSVDGSQDYAQLTHDNLCRFLCPENRRVAAPISKSIYLFQKIQCPAILVECGFLSNPGEAEKLLTPDYQRSVAVLLLASCLQYIS